MFVAKLTLCLCLMGNVFSQIMVSKSSNRSDAVVLSEKKCLKEDRYIFLNTSIVTEVYPNIQKVIWYTSKLSNKTNSNIERYNNKTVTYSPYDFKGGSPSNASAWNTRYVDNGKYEMHANVYVNDSIIDKFTADFDVCNKKTHQKSSSPTPKPSVNSTHHKHHNSTSAPSVNSTSIKHHNSTNAPSVKSTSIKHHNSTSAPSIKHHNTTI
jgi:hypothetical protein